MTRIRLMMRAKPVEGRRVVLAAWRSEGGRAERVARRLGITRRTLDRMIFADPELTAAVRADRRERLERRETGRFIRGALDTLRDTFGPHLGALGKLPPPLTTGRVQRRSRLYREDRRKLVELRVSWRRLCDAAAAGKLTVHYDVIEAAFFVRGDVTRAIRRGVLRTLPPLPRPFPPIPADLFDDEPGEARVFVAPEQGAAQVVEELE